MTTIQRWSFLMILPITAILGCGTTPHQRIKRHYPEITIPSEVVVCAPPAHPKSCRPTGTGGAGWVKAINILPVKLPSQLPGLNPNNPEQNITAIEAALQDALIKDLVGNTYDQTAALCANVSETVTPSAITEERGRERTADQ